MPDRAVPSSIEQQTQNEAVYRLLLARDVLRVLLPAADLENDCLRTLVEEILAERVLGGLVVGKWSQGWVWWEGIAKVAETTRRRPSHPPPQPAKLRMDEDDNEEAAPSKNVSPTAPTHYARFNTLVSALFRSSLHILYLLFVTLRFLVITAVTSSSLPSRSSSSSPPPSSPAKPLLPPPQPTNNPLPIPILAMPVFTTLSLLLDLPARTPWLHGLLQLIQHGLLTGPGRVAATDGWLDRYVLYIPLLPSGAPT